MEAVEALLDALNSQSEFKLSEFLREGATSTEEVLSYLPLLIDLNELSDCDGSAVGTDLPSLQHHAGFTIPGELRLGEFELQEELGRGGMGVVFKAQHLKTGAIFALKVLSPLNSRDGTLIERFRREAEAASRLNHGSFVRVDSFGREKGYYYYVMEYIAGRDLAEVVRCLRRAAALGRNRLHELSEILPFLLPTGDCPSTGNQRFFHWVACLGKQVADALEYAHKNGVIHRDIKPSNLILDPDGRIRITDLGLARIVDEASVTGTGDIVGTLRYMSPEQLRAGHRRIDQRTDIYSLGVTIYELISLAPLFPESDRERLIERILFTEPIKLRTQSPEVPQDLDAIVMRCLAKSPTDRYHTSQELADDLGRFLRGERIAPRTFHRIRHNLRSLSRRLWMIIAALLFGAALWLVADSFRHHPTKQGQFGREGLDTEWTDPRLERNRVQYLVTNSALSQGLLELERGQSADGMLWFGKALELVDSGTRLEALIRRNINGWERELAPLTDFQTISDVPLDSPSVVATSENYLAVAEKDQVTVWGLSGNIRPVARRQLKAPLTGIDLVGNDPHLLMATGDGVVEVWNFHSDEIARHSFPKAKQIRHLECSDDGMSLLTTLTDEGISIWRLEDLQKFAEKPVSAEQFPYGGSFADTGDTVYLWRGPKREIWAFKSAGHQSRALPSSAEQTRVGKLTPDGKFLFSAHANRAVLQDLDAPEIDGNIAQHFGHVPTVDVHPSGRYLLTGSHDGTVRIWNRSTMTPVGQPLEFSSRVLLAGFRPEERGVFAISESGVLKCWAFPASERAQPTLPHPSTPLGVVVADDGTCVTLTGKNWTGPQQLRVWNGLTGTLVDEHEVLSVVTQGAITSDADSLVICCNGELQIWGVAPQLKFQHSAKLPFARTSVLCLSRDNRTAFVFGGDHGMVFSVPNLEQLAEIKVPANVVSACVTFEGTRIAAVCSDSRVRIWDLESNTEVHDFTSKLPDVVDSRIDRNSVLTLVSYRGEIQSFDLSTGEVFPSFFRGNPGKQEFRLRGEESFVMGVSGDGKATWIDLETGLPVGPSFPHYAPMAALSVSANSQYLATVLPDSSVRIFTLPGISKESKQEILLRLQTLTGKKLSNDIPRFLTTLERKEFLDLLKEFVEEG